VAGTHRGSGVPEGVLAIEADVTDDDSLKAAFAEAAAVLGQIDTLVIAAGIVRDKAFLRMRRSDLSEVIEANAIGAMMATNLGVRSMLKHRSGSIVLLSSVSIRYGIPGQTNYAASKGAIEAFARALAKEHAQHGIRVNVVAPGATDTDMMASMPEAERAAMTAQIPMGRLGRPEEVAGVIVAISEATYVTGAVVPVAGGL